MYLILYLCQKCSSVVSTVNFKQTNFIDFSDLLFKHVFNKHDRNVNTRSALMAMWRREVHFFIENVFLMMIDRADGF